MAVCNRSNVGYSQGDHSQKYPYGTRWLYTSGNFENNAWYCDCSSLISYALYQAGFRFTTTGGYDQIHQAVNSPDGYTGNINYTVTWGLYYALPSCGFTKTTITSPSQYRVGDILLTNQHVVMVSQTYNSSTGYYYTAEAHGVSASSWALQVGEYGRSSVYGSCYRLSSQTATGTTGTGDSPATSSLSWSQKGNYSNGKVNGNYNLTETQKMNNLKLIYAYLGYLGWSKNARIGVMANMQCEGIVNPECYNYSSQKSSGTDSGYGLCQWTGFDSSGKTLDNMTGSPYIQSSYCPSDFHTNAKANGEGQLNYLHNYTGQWNASGAGLSWANYKVSTNSARWCTEKFFRYYEMYSGNDDGTLYKRLEVCDALEEKINNENWDTNISYQSSGSITITYNECDGTIDVSNPTKTDVDWLPYYLYLKMNKKMFW